MDSLRRAKVMWETTGKPVLLAAILVTVAVIAFPVRLMVFTILLAVVYAVEKPIRNRRKAGRR